MEWRTCGEKGELHRSIASAPGKSKFSSSHDGIGQIRCRV